MITVGVRELKNRLSEHLRMVRRGEEILVTHRGDVVAELRQPSSVPAAAAYPGLVRHARAGKGAHRRSEPARSVSVPGTVPAPPAPRGGLLYEERGDR